ncbi:OmpP1/FadL family transporter [Rubrivivax gelatinosus]|uniref:Long-chain fatty acid transporter n=1 Tax=Rubrivivax gelatinosus TaxID=28068 RepID=A0ABS1DZV7_RUBGE|nr:outer membrane protein transport protein [Rubrivivax gelatinosus]MBK1715003.1 long-chain fatty acid transporter [Rubrivivax gelatinosus]
MLRRSRTVVPAALLAAGLWPLAAHATNGYFSHGYGVRSEAVAGVGIALPQDGLTGATNPAGTAFLASRLDLGLNLFRPSRGASIEGNGAGLDGRYDGNGRKLFAIPEIGYVRPLDDSLSLGLAVYGNGGMNTQYDHSPFAAFGVAGRSGVNLEQLFISPSVAWRATPTHTFGAALNLAYQRFSADGLSPFTTASASPAHVSDRGTDTSTGAGLRLGWIWQPDAQWRLGATWSSRISGRFDKYKGLFADGGSFDIPANWGLGVAFEPAAGWTLAADYQVIEYGGVKAVANPLSRLAAGQPLGSDDGPGFGWRDVKVVKLGLLHQWSPALTLRAGLSHATQAVPAGETFFNILAPGVVQNHLTAGFSWKTGTRSEWSAFYARAFKKTVRGEGSIPAGFGGGEADVHLKEDILGASWSWNF